MNTYIKNAISKLTPRVQLGYSHLLLRLFLGVVLFISFSRCNGGGDISGWDTSQVTNMQNMFSNAYAFNQEMELVYEYRSWLPF